MAGKASESITGPKISNYSVKGATLEEVSDAISGREEAGKVDWKPSYKCAEGDDGKLSSCTVTVPITMELPKWSPPSGASAAVKKEWERFEKCLRAHEDGHVDLVKEAFEGLAEKMLEGSKADAAKTFKQACDDLQKASDKYDADTDHGMKKGCTLDVNIT